MLACRYFVVFLLGLGSLIFPKALVAGHKLPLNSHLAAQGQRLPHLGGQINHFLPVSCVDAAWCPLVAGQARSKYDT